MKDEHGTPIIGNKAEMIKQRSEAFTTVYNMVKTIPVDDPDEWMLVVSKKKNAVIADGVDLPELAFATIMLLRELADAIPTQQVFKQFCGAVNAGMDELSKTVALKMVTQGDEEVQGDIARQVLRFLQKMEKENEDGNSRVPDSGSG